MHRTVRMVLLSGLLAVVAFGSACAGVGQMGSDPWPPSQTGLPTFYYFGDPG